MLAPVLLASAVLTVLLVFAFIREMRLRRALQEVLRRLIEKWRSQNDA